MLRNGERCTPEFFDWFTTKLTLLLPKAQEFVKRPEGHAPILLAFSHSNEAAALPMASFMGSSEGKDLVHEMHRDLARQDQLTYAVFFISEAWMVSPPKGVGIDSAEVQKMFKEGISDHPDRYEVLEFNCIKMNMQLIAYYRIDKETRDLAKDPIIIDPMVGAVVGGEEGMDDMVSIGRMILNKPQEN